MKLMVHLGPRSFGTDTQSKNCLLRFKSEVWTFYQTRSFYLPCKPYSGSFLFSYLSLSPRTTFLPSCFSFQVRQYCSYEKNNFLLQYFFCRVLWYGYAKTKKQWKGTIWHTGRWRMRLCAHLVKKNFKFSQNQEGGITDHFRPNYVSLHIFILSGSNISPVPPKFPIFAETIEENYTTRHIRWSQCLTSRIGKEISSKLVKFSKLFFLSFDVAFSFAFTINYPQQMHFLFSGNEIQYFSLQQS